MAKFKAVTVKVMDCSTEDETVRCCDCGHEFDLADITL